jgi:NADH pyrophosphatase NudC (nudix superfamily)
LSVCLKQINQQEKSLTVRALNSAAMQQQWKLVTLQYANNDGTTSYFFERKVESKCSSYYSAVYNRCTITIIAIINKDQLFVPTLVATSSTNPTSWLGVI